MKIGQQVLTAPTPDCAKKSGSTPKPKTSLLEDILVYLLKKKVTAVVSKDGKCYCEIEKEDRSVSKFYFDPGSRVIKYDSSLKEHFNFMPVFISAIHNPGEYAETMAHTQDLSNEHDFEVEPETLALLCTCFYYEAKAAGAEKISTLADLNSADKTLIAQAIATGELEQVESCCGINFGTKFKDEFKMPMPVKNGKDSSNPDLTWFEDLKDYAKVIMYEWGGDAQKHIPEPNVLDDFVPNAALRILSNLAYANLTACLDRLNAGISGIDAIGGNYLNVIVTGKPGTGKTATLEALGAALNIPLYTIAITKGTEEDTFGGITKVVEGKLCFTETPFLQAYKNGGIVVLEEFNLADPAVVMGGIGQAIVPPFILYEDGYKPVTRHPLCVIAMTMNSGTQGGHPPNEALSSRAPITLVLNDPLEDDFISILTKNSGCETRDVKAVYNMYRKLQNYLATENMSDIGDSITLRHCLGALSLIKDAGLGVKEAVKHSMIGAIAIKDYDAAKEVYDAVIDPSV
jgi:hypothetical protein